MTPIFDPPIFDPPIFDPKMQLELPPLTLPTETATVLLRDCLDGSGESRELGSGYSRVEGQGFGVVGADFLQLLNDLEAATGTFGLSSSWIGPLSAVGQNSPATIPPAMLPQLPILALIPHACCEAWLDRCLRSLLAQTYPLTHIVVIDDASPEPPRALVQRYPSVTLMQSAYPVGPYGLVQQVIEQTDYWGYLFQDADDWSCGDRLAILLATALHSGAELVGSQEIRVLEEEQRLQVVGYPLDVNAALASKPGHGLLHPTSLVRRSLLQRLGGFASGLRFGGDTEFLLRAIWQAKIVNVPWACYFRRKRCNSLTTAPETGLDSPARHQLLRQLKSRYAANYNAQRLQQPLDLSPLAIAPPVPLSHLAGPTLRCL